MAFQTGSTRKNNAQQQDDSWKSQGFLNLYLPTPDGGKRKVGSIPLKEAKAFEAAVLKRLNEEGGLEAFVKNVIIEFNAVSDEPVSNVGF